MNLSIKVYLSVKFRAFGITFGNVKEARNYNPLTNNFDKIPWNDKPSGRILVNDRGIFLVVEVSNS